MRFQIERVRDFAARIARGVVVKSWFRTMIVLVPLAVWSTTLQATEDKGFNVNRYSPTVDPFGIHSVDSPEVLDPWKLSVALFYNDQKNAIEFGRSGDRRVGSLLDHLQVLQGMVAVGLPGRLQLGLNVPYVVNQSGDRLNNPQQRFDERGFADLQFELKWQAWVSQDEHWSVGAKLFGTVHNGRQSHFRGEDGGGTVGALGLVEYRSKRFRVLFKAGYQWLEENSEAGGANIDDRVLGGLAGEISLWQSRQDRDDEDSREQARDQDQDQDQEPSETEAERRNERMRKRELAEQRRRERDERERRGLRHERDIRRYELALQYSLEFSFRAKNPSSEQSFPVEALYGLVFRTSHGLSIEAGAGSGLTNGLGAPDYRGYVGLRYTFGGPSPMSGLFTRERESRERESREEREAKAERPSSK